MASVADTGDNIPPAPLEEVVVVRRRSSIGWRIAKWLGVILALLVTAIIAFLIWLNSDSGRRFIVDQINGLEMASGLKVNVDRIDGSIWSELTIHGLTLSDPQGAFFAAPQAELVYNPFAYIRDSRIDITSLVVPEARLGRLPQLRSTDPNAPMIPDLLLDIGNLQVGRLTIDPPVTGTGTCSRLAATSTWLTRQRAPICRWRRCRNRGWRGATG
jgi:translocation and assembly module TamB